MSITLHALGDLVAALPRVEGPWPERVGLELPFSAAGIGGVPGNVIAAGRSPAEQARLTSFCGLLFFRLGALAHSLLLVNQLFVGEEARQSMVAGAALGVLFCLTDASAPVIYAGITVVGAVFCLRHDGRILPRLRRGPLGRWLRR